MRYGRRLAFSLVETIMALLILVIIFVFVFSVFSTTRKGLQLSENHMNAAFIGRTLIDEIRRGGFDGAVARTGETTLKGMNDGNPFAQTFHTSVFVESTDADRKLVWVDVAWREATGDKRITVETILVKP